MDMNMRILISAQDAASQVISGLSSALGPVGGALAAVGVAAAGAAIAIGVQSVKAAADFQTGLTSLVTGAGESANAIGMVRDGILNMAVSTATSTKQLTDGMYMIDSAGYTAANGGLTVLKNAAMGAKVGNADLGTVADATTTIMKDFGISAAHSAIAVNTMIATVANGKTTMQALSGSLSQIMPTASAAGISLNDTSAALATMTGEGVPAANAATYLRQTILGLMAPSAGTVKALAAVGLTSAQVSDEMKKSLPDALAMITEAVGKKFPVGSAQYVAAIKNISGGAKTMQGMLDLTGTHMATFQQNVTNISGAVKAGGDSITGWSLVQQTFNFKLQQAQEVVETLMIKIGTALLPVLSSLMDQVMPLITQFSSWITTSGMLQTAIGNVTGELSGSGGVISNVKGYVLALVEAVGRIIGAFGDWLIKGGGLKAMLAIVGAVIANIYPPVSHLITVVSKIIADFIEWGNKSGTFNGIIHAVGATIGTVSAIVGTIIDKLASFIGWLEKGSAPANALKIALIAIGGAIALIKIGNMISDIIALIPQMIAWIAATWAEFAAETALAIAEIIANWPIYLIIAAVLLLIGIVVLLVQHWGQVIDFLRGAWSAFASWFMDALHAVGAFFASIWSGIVAFFVGTWDRLVGFAKAVWAGLVANARTIFMILLAVILGPIGLIADLIISHWAQIKAYLAAAWSWVVSTAKQLWTDVVTVFSNAWDNLKTAVTDLWNKAKALMAAWPGDMLQLGGKIIQMLAQGITGAIGTVTGAVGQVWGKISSFFPHSPPKEGPGVDLPNWGPRMIKMYADGLTSSIPLIEASMHMVMKPVASAMGTSPASSMSPVSSSGSAGSAGSTGNTTIVLSPVFNITARPQDESEMERIAKFTLTYLTEHVQGQFGNLYAGGR